MHPSRWLRNAARAPWLPVAAYLAYVGIRALTDDSPVARFLPAWLDAGWTAALIAGSVLVVAGTVTARTRAESAGHALHLAGIALYAACYATALHVDAVAAILTLGGVAAIRLHVLSEARAAREEAADLIRPPEGGR